MPQPAALRRNLPSPVRAALKRVAGWAYLLRRRSLRSRSDAAPAAVAGDADIDLSALPAVPAEVLDPGAPECVLASNRHGVYCVPRSLALRRPPRPVLQGLLRSRVWESDTLDLLCACEPEGDVVHAGAFIGDFLPALAHFRRGGARVWAFEPNRETFQCAQATATLNSLEHGVLSNAGLAASTGAALLAVSDREGQPLGGGSRILSDRSRARWRSTEEIALTSIDDTLGAGRNVAAIHLTVQRHEREAFAGALSTIERCRPLIVLAALPGSEWVAANLAPLGYRARDRVDNNPVFSCA